MASSEEVTLQVATADDAPVLANLLEFYLHDLSEAFPLDVKADGRYGYQWLPLYWTEPHKRFAFLIRVGGRLAGCILVTRGSPATHDPDDLDVAEFFILRRYRRCGIGRRAAVLLWNRMAGKWIVRVLEANRAGMLFWEPVIRDYTNGDFVKRDHFIHAHNSCIFTFRSDGENA